MTYNERISHTTEKEVLVDPEEQIVLSEKYPFHPAALETLQAEYPHLAYAEEDDLISFNVSRFSEEQLYFFYQDISFFINNPELPRENIICRLDNFHPRNASQERLLQAAYDFAATETYKGRGLFVTGAVGTGKTHSAVALAKQFFMLGEETRYIADPGYRDTREIDREDRRITRTWILDDMNSPFGEGMKYFKQITMRVHNTGGKVFVTSNQPLEYLLSHGFVTEPNEEERFRDRIKGMYEIIKVTGESYRKPAGIR
ncbi:hypothetical protein HY468_04240 [Candidatus Roizmanbacteria bacterium]|nr:hypothetical protein [Candidatus Roizmanbacteria bacterium]